MKKLRLKFIQRMNVMLASIITFLGFSGCKQQKNIAETATETATVQEQTQSTIEEPINIKSDIMEEPLVCKYGVPMAKHHISGTVTDEKKRPLPNMQVVVETTEGRTDVLITDSVGNFRFTEKGMPSDSIRITVVDKRGLYLSESQTIKLNYVGGDNEWDLGEAVGQLTFVLKRSNEQLKKYGVPPVRRTDNTKQSDPLPEGKPIK